MIKRLPQLAIMFIMASTLFYCVENEQILPPDVDAASRLKPLAFAGQDVVINLPTNLVLLDGRKSTNTQGNIVSYEWTKIAGPASFKIVWPFRAITKVTKLTEGTYKFRLTVTNDRNLKHFDDVVIKVTGELYFVGDMNNVSISSGHLGFKGWDKLKNHQHVKYMHLNNIGNAPYAYQQIVKDPIDKTSNVMYAAVIDDDPNWRGTTRAQTTIRFKDGVDLPVYHTSHRMYLNPDIDYLKNYPDRITWFTLFETWNRHVDGWSGDPAGAARWNFALNKDKGIGKPLFWKIDAQFMQPAAKEQDFIWAYSNKTVPIPYGKWFTLDIYMKRGQGTNGRFTIKLTVDGGPTNVLFDVANTTIYPGHPEIELETWQPFKLYTSDARYDWMRSKGKKISAYYDDFKWYKN